MAAPATLSKLHRKSDKGEAHSTTAPT